MYKYVENMINEKYARDLYEAYILRKPSLVIHNGITYNKRANDIMFPLDAETFFKNSGFNAFEYTPHTSVYIHRFAEGFELDWHDDHDMVNQATVYITPYWDSDMGGLFLQQNADPIVPKFNCGVIQESPVQHKITKILGNQVRLSIQIMQIKG
tara:strand:- start:69 stop:530 length:462 start_codon:yes stop_codon:yes gene_type:complete